MVHPRDERGTDPGSLDPDPADALLPLGDQAHRGLRAEVPADRREPRRALPASEGPGPPDVLRLLQRQEGLRELQEQGERTRHRHPEDKGIPQDLASGPLHAALCDRECGKGQRVP